jgi:hypothetical protein
MSEIAEKLMFDGVLSPDEMNGWFLATVCP